MGATPSPAVGIDLGTPFSVVAHLDATGRPRNSIVIPRNSVLPVTKGKRFKTHRDNQPTVAIHVIEGRPVA